MKKLCQYKADFYVQLHIDGLQDGYSIFQIIWLKVELPELDNPAILDVHVDDVNHERHPQRRDENQARRMGNGRCYKCGLRGHYAVACRSRMYFTKTTNIIIVL
ncbi:---NA--- [Paramuricea clavata]|uniref:---NA n=1 Tax=Paramuricea clavata TaxID=317549 RepID=A0A6S7GSX8_PARCT|nr:---NA--- [Paramuricea clavata]